MDCPRCGTRLTRISLNGEFQSVYCERCRFADVESDHTRASEGGETWDDALRRFRSANAAGESEGDADTGRDSDGDAAETDRTDDTSGDDDGAPDGGADATAEDSESESDHPEDDDEADEA